MKNQKFIALAVMSIFSILLIYTSLVSAGTNAYVKNGNLDYRIRYDLDSFVAPCAKGPVSPHVNLEIWQKSKMKANWHIGWEGKCVIAYDPVGSKKCVKVCYENQGKGKLTDILSEIGISNSARRAIEKSSDAIDIFRKIGISVGKSPGTGWYFPAIGATVIAGTYAIAYGIAKVIAALNGIAI